MNASGRTLDKQVQRIGKQLADQLDQIAAPQPHLPVRVAAVHQAVSTALTQLEKLDYWGPENRLPSEIFWRLNERWLGQGRLQVHARTKPHGYAGDHQMLRWICEDRRDGDEWAWTFDDFFQQQAAPHAVRNRAQIVADAMSEAAQQAAEAGRPCKIVSFGSGPAWDAELFLSSSPSPTDHVEILLIDIDPRALQAASEHCRRAAPDAKLSCHQANLKRVFMRGRGLDLLAEADLISCSGYCDYLDDAEAQQMIATLWQSIRDGGSIVVFNFGDDNPSRAYMEWIGNWYLQYRSPDELRQIGLAAEIPPHAITVGTELAGVNLFLRSTKS